MSILGLRFPEPDFTFYFDSILAQGFTADSGYSNAVSEKVNYYRQSKKGLLDIASSIKKMAIGLRKLLQKVKKEVLTWQAVMGLLFILNPLVSSYPLKALQKSEDRLIPELQKKKKKKAIL